jgi:predicted ATPase/class 3 adenylate cyclase/Flp pilus assembly protein TadD
MPTAVSADSNWPTGTLTFVFTDIEGSTTLWEKTPEAMQDALAQHDRTLREAIASAGGRIVKSTGDGVHAVFDTPVKALIACITAQRALQAVALRARAGAPEEGGETAPPVLKVRMGMHAGTAELRDRDYYGTTLNRAARIMSAAHGEQILLSAAAAELLQGRLPAGVSLREMGEHRLKGLLKPERLLQVIAPDLRADFPPLATLTGHNLPTERDAFVGRREALAELARRIDAGARLISVLGIGGTGKTRLVTRFGWHAIGLFPGGVWFCDLADARDTDGIVHAVAHGLDVPLGNDDAVQRLGRALARRGKCLVILDNFEQVAPHAQATVGRWLNHAVEARFLVTTRATLGIAGEQILQLPPLSPTAAAALFSSRAGAIKPDFAHDADDQAAIAPLVQLLEGLPLAIELAAARVRVLRPRALLQRMSERFKLLASTGGRLERQSTLRAVYDWSWDLLNGPERAAFAQLSVFEGGFTVEAAEAVLELAAFENAPWPVDVLQSLVQKSLVRQATYDRFDLLVSAKEYAAEHLRTEGRYAGSGPAALTAAEARHGAYFARLGEKGAIANGCADLDNLVAACRRAASRGESDVAARTLLGAWAGLNMLGPYRLGIELAARVRATLQPAAAVAVEVDWVTARALMNEGKYVEANSFYETVAARAHETGNRLFEARAHFGLGTCAIRTGRLDAAPLHFETARTLARALDDRNVEVDALIGLGNLEVMRGRMTKARACFESAAALARGSGNRRHEGFLLHNLGMLCLDIGDTDAALVHATAALAAAKEAGDRRLEGSAYCGLGHIHRMQERFEEALRHLEPARAILRDTGDVHLEWFAELSIGMACDGLGRFAEARQHYAAALDIARNLGDSRSEGDCLGQLGLAHARQGRHEEARRFLDEAEAVLRARPDRMAVGIFQCWRAEAERRAGDESAAAKALAEAELIAIELEADADSQLRRALARVRDLPALDQTTRTDRPVVD